MSAVSPVDRTPFGCERPRIGKAAAAVLRAGLALCAVVVLLVLGLRFAVYEYTHGDRQTVVHLSHALSRPGA